MRIFLITAYLVAVSTDAAPLGCSRHSHPSVDEDTVYYSDADADADGDSDSDGDGDADADADADGDADADTDTDTSAQPPFEIRISNSSAGPMYVDLSMGTNGIVSCAREDGSECFLFEPFCTRPCADVPSDESCDSGVCDPFARVRLVDADNPLILAFDGKLRVKNSNYCESGTCFDLVPMPSGTYTLTLYTWPEYTCVSTNCAEENNTVNFAAPSGTMQKISLMFDSPRSEDLRFEIVK